VAVATDAVEALLLVALLRLRLRRLRVVPLSYPVVAATDAVAAQLAALPLSKAAVVTDAVVDQLLAALLLLRPRALLKLRVDPCLINSLPI
jgi:hypothetical protein